MQDLRPTCHDSRWEAFVCIPCNRWRPKPGRGSGRTGTPKSDDDFDLRASGGRRRRPNREPVRPRKHSSRLTQRKNAVRLAVRHHGLSATTGRWMLPGCVPIRHFVLGRQAWHSSFKTWQDRRAYCQRIRPCPAFPRRFCVFRTRVNLPCMLILMDGKRRGRPPSKAGSKISVTIRLTADELTTAQYHAGVRKVTLRRWLEWAIGRAGRTG